MHGNSTLDHHICVFLSGLKIFKFAIESVESHLNASTTRKLLSLWSSASVLLAGVVFTANLVFVSLNEFGNHLPQKLHLVSLVGGHWWTQVSQLMLSISLLVFYFRDD